MSVTQVATSAIVNCWFFLASFGLTGILAVWGAFVSTGLAAIKVWEIWRGRIRLYTSCSLSSGNQGNDITIKNTSGQTVMVDWWELQWRKPVMLIRNRITKSIEYGFPEDSKDFILSGYSSMTFNFSEMDYFNWGHKTIKLGRLYMLVRIVGRRKPILLHVYDPRR